MHKFNSDGVEIAYYVEGEGPPILLIHGFASNAQVNWIDTGWVSTLVRAGRQVVALDNRGHGNSEKLYEPAAYSAPIMAEDAARLMAHLGFTKIDVMGYSMGARISAFLTMKHQNLVNAAVFAGLAENMIKGVGGAEAVASALEAPDKSLVRDAASRGFRLFAEQTGSDLRALAACMRSSRQKITEAELSVIEVPALVAVGTEDTIAGAIEPLQNAVQNGYALPIPGRDHMRAVGDKVYKQGVLDFFANHPLMT
ncbi:MAG: alpha/beta fold hydrolase [Hyphomicrobiales bacterium]